MFWVRGEGEGGLLESTALSRILNYNPISICMFTKYAISSFINISETAAMKFGNLVMLYSWVLRIEVFGCLLEVERLHNNKLYNKCSL